MTNSNPDVLSSNPAVLRRTWPQRLVIVASAVTIVAAVVSVNAVQIVERALEDVDRIPIVDTGRYGRQLLAPQTATGEPVNFLIVGTDSALGLDPSDPAAQGREINPTGRSLADTIMLLRLDPVSKSAWVLSIPRDLWADIPGAQDNKIASAFFIDGAPLLVATITSMFDVDINHYVQMDFAAFERVVDTLGGVPVWFPYPARDRKSGLNISEPGCHVLDGRRALQYVRSRTYQELVDGRWRVTQGDDFGRIERQQDFLILALDRAISRGARNPLTMVQMLEAGAASLTLDQTLKVTEMITLARAFADFNPDNLHRDRLDVYTVQWPDGSYKGEAANKEANEPKLAVFRGADPTAVTESSAEQTAPTTPTAQIVSTGPTAQIVSNTGAGAAGPGLAAAARFGASGAVAGITERASLIVAQSQTEGETTILGRPPEGQVCG